MKIKEALEDGTLSLEDDIDYTDMTEEEYKQEIERLNNIINELEEYIKPYLYMLNGIQDRDVYEEQQLDDFTDIMEKLQELKGSDKE